MSDSTDLVIRIIGDDAQYTKVIKRVERGIQQASGSVRQFGHTSRSSYIEASAAIRLLQGDTTNMVRAAEAMVSRCRVLSAALKVAFPAIGVIAIGAVLVEGTERLVKFIETARQVPQALTQGFESLITSQQSANDALAVTNDKLQMEIDKLENKPVNGLKLALDEARSSADELAKSLESDMSRMDSLLKQHQIGFFASMFTDQGGTGFVSDQVKKYEARLSDLGYQYQQAVRMGPAYAPDAQFIKSEIGGTRNDAQAWARSQIADRRTGKHTVGDQTANLTILEGFDQSITDREDSEQLQAQNKALDARKTILQAHTDAAKKAAEAAQKALARQKQVWTDGLEQLKSVQDISAKQEADYWLDAATQVKGGSQTYIYALQQAYKAMAPVQKELAKSHDTWTALQTRIGKSFANSAGQQQNGEMALPDDLSKGLRPNDSDKDTVTYLTNLNKGVDIRRQNATAIAEASLQMQVATGRMSAHDAAVVQAQMHTQEYTDSLHRLQDALKAAGNDQATASGIRNQIAQLHGQYGLDSQSDRQAISSTTLGGASRDALNEMVQSWTDMTAQLKDLIPQSLDRLNSSLANSLVAHAHTGRDYRRNIVQGLSNTSRGIGSSLLQKGMQGAEGSLLKRFGFGGKPDGSASKPFHVIMSGLGSAGSSVGSGISSVLSRIPLLGKLFGGGGSTSSMVNDGGMGSNSLSLTSLAATLFQGGFAGGGDFMANRPMLVGEEGPEIAMFGRSGTIIPNHQAFGSHTVNVDARGSHDPAQTEAAVHRAMQKYVPTAAAMAVRGVNEQNLRRPPSARR